MNVWVESLLDGFTGAGLFGRLRRPGAPITLIAESRVDLTGPVLDAFREKMGMAMSDFRRRLREDARLREKLYYSSPTVRYSELAKLEHLLDLASTRYVAPARHGT